jgi:hypothetical protein
MTSFRLIYDGLHGKTVESKNPKLDAYQQMAYLANVLGRKYTLICHEDGAIHGDW